MTEKSDATHDQADQVLSAAEQQWTDHAVRQLHRREVELPSDIQQRLISMRRDAVAALEYSEHNGWNWKLPLGGLATAGAVLFAALLLLRGPVPELPVLEGIDSIMAVEIANDVELLEDLEFVAWMLALEEAETQRQPASG